MICEIHNKVNKMFIDQPKNVEAERLKKMREEELKRDKNYYIKNRR